MPTVIPVITCNPRSQKLTVNRTPLRRNAISQELQKRGYCSLHPLKTLAARTLARKGDRFPLQSVDDSSKMHAYLPDSQSLFHNDVVVEVLAAEFEYESQTGLLAIDGTASFAHHKARSRVPLDTRAFRSRCRTPSSGSPSAHRTRKPLAWMVVESGWPIGICHRVSWLRVSVI